VLAWAGENPLAALTLIGLLFYGFLRFTYVSFYGGLGLDPGEVGLSYRETLARGAALLPFFFGPLVFGAVLAMAIVVGSWWALVRLGKLARIVPCRVPAAPRTRDFFAFATVYGLTCSLIAAVVFAALGVPGDVADVKDGVSIEAGAFAPYSAVPARLNWIGSGAPPVLRRIVREQRRLIYLGKADGAFVLYEPREGRTIQVPTSVAVLILEP
jgi:hypothetical protein